MSGAVSDLVGKVYEWRKPAGGSWVFDAANATTANGGTGSGNNLTSPAVTTSGSPSVCAMAFAVDGQGLMNAIPASGSAVFGGYIGAADRNGVAAWMGTGSATAVVSDETSGDSFNSSNGCEK